MVWAWRSVAWASGKTGGPSGLIHAHGNQPAIRVLSLSNDRPTDRPALAFWQPTHRLGLVHCRGLHSIVRLILICPLLLLSRPRASH